MKLTATGVTDIGRKRPNNEDSIGMDLERGIFIVADGMGGHAAGEVASRIVVDTVLVHKGAEGEALIIDSLNIASSEICALSRKEADKSGMGSTAAVLILSGGKVVAGWVGDSRIYLYRAKKLKALTRDHSRVQALIDAGMITEKVARAHPARNLITRAVGVDPNVEVDVVSLKVKKGDLYLLCTDGISGVLGNEGIAAIIAEDADPDTLPQRLVDAANGRDGGDNSSVISILVESL